MDKQTVGKRIANIRKELGLTLEEFGKKVHDANKSIVSKWERGDTLPSNKRIKRIAEIGGTSTEELLNDKKPLLVIEVDDLNSVPRVYYKGEEIKNKHSIDYEWLTKDSEINSGLNKVTLDYYDNEQNRIVIKNSKGKEGKTIVPPLK